MATPYPNKISMAEASTYQQAMLGMNAIVIARPGENGYVMVQPQQLTRVATQPGQHYKVRQLGSDAKTLQTPDNVVAVRHADALHLRYADGSTASFDGFYAVCTDSSVCSVNLASDDAAGMTLDGANASGGVGDDGMMVYAHGNRDTLMAMAQDQSSMLSALRALDEMAVITYLPPDSHLGVLALLALGASGAVHAGATGGVAALGGEAAVAVAVAVTPIDTISTAAQNNTAASSGLAVSNYVAASVTGVTAANLASINSALDSAAVNGAKADTPVEVQAIVNAYQAILNSAVGIVDSNVSGATAQQYALIGVTGVSGTPAADSGIHLLNNVIRAQSTAGVDTEAEVQALADAANHVISAAGGTPAQIAALTLADLTAMGITGVTPDNLPAVLAAIGATAPDTNIDTLGELQGVVNAAAAAAANALNSIAAAAQGNTASDTSPAISVYLAAGVSGVTGADLPSINSALNSLPIAGAQADTTAEVQAIVNAYNTIRTSADGTQDNTLPALTGTPYTLVGVTGVSGVSAPGNALHLLDSVVDASLVPAVDTVPELQSMANAAAQVITGSAGGTAATLADLTALGITGVNAGNLAAVQAAIAATPDDGTGVDTRGELQAVASAVTGSVQVPHIVSTLGGVTNLEVTSNLVLSADQSVSVGSGFIHINDLGGAGYKGDTSNNTQTIDVATALANHLLTITGSGANTHIVVNPLWDLDLSSNYELSFDSGVFLDTSGSHAAIAVAPINFSTVAPGTHSTGSAATEAHASQMMLDTTGALAVGKSWLSIEGIGNSTGSVGQLGDLSGGAYALVMKNYATTRGGDPLTGGDGSDGIAAHDTNVGVLNFGNNDIVYFDSQVNSTATQFFDARYTSMTDGGSRAGLTGQNAMVMGVVFAPAQQGNAAMILLGLEGNSSNQIYPSVVSFGTTVGWSDVWHSTSPAVIMG
jgi:hypothetical protein